MDSADFTILLWSELLQFPYQTMMQLVRMLLMLPLRKVDRVGGGRRTMFRQLASVCCLAHQCRLVRELDNMTGIIVD